MGGTISGLLGSGLVLQEKGGDALSVNANGVFTFATAVTSGSAYDVSVTAQPTSPAQKCTVANGSGTANADVGNVAVTCTTRASVSPAIAAIAAASQAGFSARDELGASIDVTWRVNGVPGGTPATGSISTTGVYTAPSTIPEGGTVLVTAVLTVDTSTQFTATVFFLPSPTLKDYFTTFPRVVDAVQPDRSRLFVVPGPTVASVTFVPRTGGAARPLGSVGDGVFVLDLDSAEALSGYELSTLHNWVGFIDHKDAAGALVKRTNYSVNVRDAAMPDVQVVPIAADAQRSPFVLNLRVDTAISGASVNSTIVPRALQLLGDNFDFVAIIANIGSNHNRTYNGVRNDASGIGLTVYDSSQSYGSLGRLRGLIHIPIDSFFDGAEAGFLHEIGHAWINFATALPLRAGQPHWPPSDLANGIMGSSISGSNVGGEFPWGIVAVGNGNYRIERRSPSFLFTSWDLYLMGLLPPASVAPALILPTSLDPLSLADGLVTTATPYTINEYVTAHGARLPTSATSQKEFRVAVVVLSFGRLLSSSEMAFFDSAAARAESTVELRTVIGVAGPRPAKPFWVATGGLGTLRTRIN